MPLRPIHYRPTGNVQGEETCYNDVIIIVIKFLSSVLYDYPFDDQVTVF